MAMCYFMYKYMHIGWRLTFIFVTFIRKFILISQASVYSKEGVCLGAVAEQESWVWTCKPRPGSNNNNQVV